MTMASRLLRNMSLFCRISSLLQSSFAKETYNFQEPKNCSHPIIHRNTAIFVGIPACCAESCECSLAAYVLHQCAPMLPICIYMYIYVYAFVYGCVQHNKQIYIYTHTYIFVFVYLYVWMHKYTYIDIYTYLYMYTFIQIQLYIYVDI